MIREQSWRMSDVLLTGIAVALFLYSVHYWNFLCDDSFISFRYARNLVEGHGLRYNLNENPPVEGYSNFLWVLIMALVMKLGASPLVASRIISVTCGVVLLVLVYRTSRYTLGLGRLQAFAGSLFCAFMPPFTVWATGGLETMLFVLLFYLQFTLLLEASAVFPLKRAAVLGLLLMLLRPEGIGYAVLLVLIAALYYRYSGRRGNWRGGIVRYLMVLAAGLLILTIFRLVYFHAPLPNTFYAKVGFTHDQVKRGVFYVVHFMFDFPGALLALFAAGVALRRKAVPGEVWAVTALAVIFIVIQILLGGDFMAMARFMVPLVPLLGLLTAAALCPPSGSLKRPVGLVLLVVTAGAMGLNMLPRFDLHATPLSWRERVHFRWNHVYYMSEHEYWYRMKVNVEQWTLIGNLLRSMSTPDQSIVTGGIGAMGYYSRMRVYDKFGLVSREVARSDIPRDQMSAGHDKSVDPFFFSKYHPDYVDPRLVILEDVENWKIKMMRSLLVRSKSHNRSHLRERFLQFKEDYEIFTHPVSYQFEGDPMIFITVRLKESARDRPGT